MNGRSSRDFFDCFAGGGSDISMFRYNVVRGGDGLGGRKSLVGKKDEDVDSQEVGIKLEYTRLGS